ncbi:MAG: XdhC family protein [Leptolinea sp.]|nr:XdhC family protein [Leptolinea sp.]
MKKLYTTMADLLRSRESFVIATLFDKTGSAPRSDGAKMIVRADGSIFGSVGGGRLEAAAIDLAKKSISEKKSLIQNFNLTSKDAADSDMICGGKGEILIDFIDADDQNNLVIFTEAAAIASQGGKGWLITILENKPAGEKGVTRQHCLVKADRTMVGSVDCHPDLLEHLINGPAKISLHSEVFDDQRFLVEPLQEGGTVFLFGAGHVSQKIAPLSESVGFRTIVLDDRAEYANREHFPLPVEVRVIEDFRRLPDLEIDNDSYLVIVTRGHLFDKDVLAQVLRTGAAYIGMIGSRTKRDLIYKELTKRGFCMDELNRVYCPIGIAIGAETPEELGISIVGELVKVRAERQKLLKAGK